MLFYCGSTQEQSLFHAEARQFESMGNLTLINYEMNKKTGLRTNMLLSDSHGLGWIGLGWY